MSTYVKDRNQLLQSSSDLLTDFAPRVRLTESLKERLQVMMEKDKRYIEKLDERHMAKAERSIEKLRPLRGAPLADILPIPSCCKSTP